MYSPFDVDYTLDGEYVDGDCMTRPAPTPLQQLIEDRLAEVGISKFQLGKSAGIHYNAVYAWFRTENPITPSDDSLLRIAPILRVPHERLMLAAGRLSPTVATPDPPEAKLLQIAHTLRQRAKELIADAEALEREHQPPVPPVEARRKRGRPSVRGSMVIGAFAALSSLAIPLSDVNASPLTEQVSHTIESDTTPKIDYGRQKRRKTASMQLAA